MMITDVGRAYTSSSTTKLGAPAAVGMAWLDAGGGETSTVTHRSGAARNSRLSQPCTGRLGDFQALGDP